MTKGYFTDAEIAEIRSEPSPQAVGCAIRGQTWGEVG